MATAQVKAGDLDAIERKSRQLDFKAERMFDAIGDLVPADLARGDTAQFDVVTKALQEVVACWGEFNRLLDFEEKP